MTNQEPRSLRGKFPFRLAAPSFIFPDHIFPNAVRLAPCLDEIEVLVLESAPECLPSPEEIAALADLGREKDLSYNVHLPMDLDPVQEDPAGRRQDLASLNRAVERVLPLSPTTFTLHLPFSGSLDTWIGRVRESLDTLLSWEVPPERFSVETLDYPLDWLVPLLTESGLSVCLDVGHLLLAGTDPLAFLDRHRERITILHLHGVSAGRDHRDLGQLPPSLLTALLKRLKDFQGTVSLEVFSEKRLSASLKVLEEAWNQHGRTR